jgi:hypothetical protein
MEDSEDIDENEVDPDKRTDTVYNICSSAGIFISDRNCKLTRQAILNDKYKPIQSIEWPKGTKDKKHDQEEKDQKHTYFPKHDK